jgi:hypothetical protein
MTTKTKLSALVVAAATLSTCKKAVGAMRYTLRVRMVPQ